MQIKVVWFNFHVVLALVETQEPHTHTS
jgi:hypothetical protein